LKVLINAASVKEGGPKVVLTRLLSAMVEVKPETQWIVAAHPACIPAGSSHPSVLWTPAMAGDSVLDVFRWYEQELPALVQKYRPSALFSQTNYLPRRRLACPAMLLVQHAGHFSAEFDRLMKGSLNSRLARFIWERKGAWVRRSAHRADLLVVQTRAFAESVSTQGVRSREEITVISPGPGLTTHRPAARTDRTPERFRIGYITKWGVQKNFATLLKAAGRLAGSGFRFQVVLTLDEGLRPVREVLGLARTLGIEGLIENHGEVSQEEISRIYDSLDMFVFASVCESFGFPTVEAMARGLPIVVAGTKGNIEVAGEAVLAFEPYDPESLAAHLGALMDDHQLRARQAERSLQASRAFSWERAAKETLSALESLTRAA
jgi:glycosyltransferase involved in cell wall biosynthesis